MQVTKRNGSLESVNLDKIVKSISNHLSGELIGLDAYEIALTTISGLYDGVSTRDLDLLSIKTAASKTVDDPLYSKLAARILSNFIRKEVHKHDVMSFSQSIKLNYESGLISEQTYKFVMDNARKLNNAIDSDKNNLFEYFGLQIVFDRYLLKHPKLRTVTETPQYWLMRVACGLSDNTKEAIEFYNLLSSHECLSSTPTLFNSGTRHSQMSSCYLLASPNDDLRDIYKRYADIALLSKWAGGIGLSYSRVRSSGALIKGTNGKSNGIIPFIHTLDSSIKAVNQCFLPYTAIRTNKGSKYIADLVCGDFIITSNGYDEVTEVIEGDYNGEVVRIKTNLGDVYVTPEHPVLVVENGDGDNHLQEKIEKGIIKPKWKPVCELNTSDIILEVKNEKNDHREI